MVHEKLLQKNSLERQDDEKVNEVDERMDENGWWMKTWMWKDECCKHEWGCIHTSGETKRCKSGIKNSEWCLKKVLSISIFEVFKKQIWGGFSIFYIFSKIVSIM